MSMHWRRYCNASIAMLLEIIMDGLIFVKSRVYENIRLRCDTTSCYRGIILM